MKKPSMPNKPNKPNEPEAPDKEVFFAEVLEAYSDDQEFNLTELANKYSGKEVWIEITHVQDYDGCGFGTEIYENKIIPNPNYDSEFKLYQKKLNKYNEVDLPVYEKKLEIYQAKMEEYDKLMKEWQKFDKEFQIQRLEKQLLKLKKEKLESPKP